MTFRSALLLTLLAGAAAAPRLLAQDRAVLLGDRVRVTDATKWTGLVQGVSPDTIDVVPDGERSSRPVAFSGVKRVEISLGERGKGRGFLIGGLGGAGIAAG